MNVTFLRIYCSHHVSLLVILFVMEIRKEREREREIHANCTLVDRNLIGYQQSCYTCMCFNFCRELLMVIMKRKERRRRRKRKLLLIKN